MEHAHPSEVEAWLAGQRGIDFPVTKEDLVAALEETGAPEPVARAVRAIPLGTYQRRDEVVAAADTVPDERPDAATHAARQRARGPIAEGERDVDLPPLHGEEGIDR